MDRERDHVVPGLRGQDLDGGVDHLRRWPAAQPGEEETQPVDALVDVAAAALDETVGVEERRAWIAEGTVRPGTGGTRTISG